MGYVEVAVVLDRSGSMSTRVNDTIGGYNTFVKSLQDEPGDAFLTLAQFDDIYEVVHDHEELMKVTLLDNSKYVPRGSTALLDAIGRTIMGIKGRLSGEAIQPDKVIICILTDGEENCSKEFNRSQIFDLIEACQKDKWEFVFLGADKNSIDEAKTYGIPAINVFMYDSNSCSGTSRACNTMSNYVNSSRSMVNNNPAKIVVVDNMNAPQPKSKKDKKKDKKPKN